VIAAAVIPWLLGGWTPLTALGILLAAWIATPGAMQIAKRLKSGNPPLSYWGMHLGHLGIGVFVVGVTLVGGFQEEKDVRMEPGEPRRRRHRQVWGRTVQGRTTRRARRVRGEPGRQGPALTESAPTPRPCP
jgi:cytochrome c biogenesis factor